jgi:hypothetical protein
MEGDEELTGEETRAMIEAALTELPQTEFAKQAALAAANGGTGNLFLMRKGEYTVGQPVTVAGQVPSLAGLMAPGEAVYELTAVSDTQATLEVEVRPQPVDLAAMFTQFMAEAGAIFGEDAAEKSTMFDEMTAEERQQFDAVAAMLFQPYTVTLTLDTVTGWVTGAEWEATFTMPEGAGDGSDGMEDFGGTLVFKSTVS